MGALCNNVTHTAANEREEGRGWGEREQGVGEVVGKVKGGG